MNARLGSWSLAFGPFRAARRIGSLPALNGDAHGRRPHDRLPAPWTGHSAAEAKRAEGAQMLTTTNQRRAFIRRRLSRGRLVRESQSSCARAPYVAFLDDSRVSGWQAPAKGQEAPKNANGHERGVRVHPASPAQIVTVQATEPLRAQHRRLYRYGDPEW